MHVVFGVFCLCMTLALNARLPGKVHQAPCDKIMKPGTSQDMKWTWLQVAQWLNREGRKLWGPKQKMLKLTPYPNRRETDAKAHMHKGEGSRRHEKHHRRRRPWTGPRWAQAGRPNPFWAPFTASFDYTTLRLFIVPVPRATDYTIHHSPPRSREERDTIPDRRGSW
jgi:hypothetical protein